MFFRAKKWLWTKLTEGRGPDKAYAKYLANFNRVQANTDGALQKELNVKAMTKAVFIRVWNGTNQSKPGKSKPGCCS
jgi:retron-type reverse transcriptase